MLVIACFAVLALGFAIILLPSIPDQKIVDEGKSLPLSGALIGLSIIGLVLSRFTKIKGPGGVELEAEPEPVKKNDANAAVSPPAPKPPEPPK